MAKIDGIDFSTVYTHGDGAVFKDVSGNVVAKRLIINGHDNTGYTERFRIFGNIGMGDELPTAYPDFDTLIDLGWNYDTAKRLAEAPIHVVFGPSGAGVTAVASTTYIYGPSGITGPSGTPMVSGTTGPAWATGYTYCQEVVEVYIDGVIE